MYGNRWWADGGETVAVASSPELRHRLECKHCLVRDELGIQLHIPHSKPI